MFQSCTENSSNYKYKYKYEMSNGTAICDSSYAGRKNVCGKMMCQCDAIFLEKIKAITLKSGCPTVNPGCWLKCNMNTNYYTSYGVNQSSWSKFFLLRNFMNINGITLFFFFLSPSLCARPGLFTASKIEHDNFWTNIQILYLKIGILVP